MAKFKFLIGGTSYLDYGGKWYRRVGDRRYHVMELMNWAEACGDEIEHTYNVSLSEIDLWEIPFSEMVSAYRSCHWDGLFEEADNYVYKMTEISRSLMCDARFKKGYYFPYVAKQIDKIVEDLFEEVLEDKDKQLIMIEMLHSYGLKAPLLDVNGNNARKLMKECRECSDALDDPYEREEAMNRVVNKVGSSARDFMQGDMMSGLNRHFEKGIYENICTEMNMGGKIFEGIQANVYMNKIPSDDPLAYTAGYMDALSRRGMASEDKSELAEAYIEGYRFGVKVRKGDESKPIWHG